MHQKKNKKKHLFPGKNWGCLVALSGYSMLQYNMTQLQTTQLRIGLSSTPEPSDSRSSSFMASERYRKHQMLPSGYVKITMANHH